MNRHLRVLVVAATCLALGVSSVLAKEKKETEKTVSKTTVRSSEVKKAGATVKAGETSSKSTSPTKTKTKVGTTSTSTKQQSIKGSAVIGVPQKLTVDPLAPELQTAPLAPATGEQINWQVLSGGGGSGGSTNFGLISVIGQTAVGFGGSTNFNISHGFLQDFGPTTPPGCCDLAGDANDNGAVNIADAIFLINRVFGSPAGPKPPCCEEGDANGNGSVNIADAIYIINRVFGSPAGPEPICGPVDMTCGV